MMSKYTLLTLASFLCLIFAFVMKDQVFPDMECETLEDETVQLPADISGKYSIIGLAYSQKAEDDLKTWYKPVYYKFVHEPEDPPMFYEPYDVNLYFVPMFSGVKKAAAGKVKKKMLEGVDPKLQPHILIYKGSAKEYKDELNLEEKDTPYFFVLDEEGKIIHREEGAFSKSKLANIEKVIDDF